ncbi:MAG: hypothetical protein K0V04_20465 [Deltaproteobacteria bacterium]|nr:hypothetical protein [Deltaproteobacteria bacterium]
MAGLHWEDEDGLPCQVTTADGTRWLRSEARAGTRRWVLHLPDHTEIGVERDAADHPVLGRCDRFIGPAGDVLAHGTAIDWHRPRQIPALDRPGALPRGAGTAILNLLAGQAARTHGQRLRYHGPYPSPALWSTLRASFSIDGDLESAASRFTAEAMTRALAGRHAEIAVDFLPAPHAWHWTHPRVCVQRRTGIERVYVDGRAFDHNPTSPRRLVEHGDGLVARIVVGGTSWQDVLRLDGEGVPTSDPLGLPSPPEELVGTALPSAVAAILGEVLAGQAPALLRAAMHHQMTTKPLRWGALGDDLVRCGDDAIELHAALVDVLPTDSTALLGVLVQLLEGPVRRSAARSLAETWQRAISDPPVA